MGSEIRLIPLKAWKEINMRRLIHVIDSMSDWSGRIFSYLLLVTMLIIGFNVMMRLFGSPQIWAFDMSLYSAGAVYVVGGAYTLLKDRHVKMDILYVRFSVRTRALLDLLTLPGFLLFCGILLWIGWIRGWESFKMGETLYTGFQPIVWPLRLTIPLGGLLILLQGFAKAVRDLYMVVKGRSLE